MPLDAGADAPGDVHPAILPQRHAPVLEARDFARQQRDHVHPLVGDRESLDDAPLDVLEDVRAEPVHRVRFAVVADDQQVVGRSAALAGARSQSENDERCSTSGFHVRPSGLWLLASGLEADISLAASGTGIEPKLNTSSWNVFDEKAAPREASSADRRRQRSRSPSQYIMAVPGNIEHFVVSA